ncbi:hypothetical protein [Helicobacter sp. T3_23-1056]
MTKKLVALCALIVCTISIVMSNDGYALRRYKPGEQLEIYKKEGKKFYRFWGLDYCLGYSKKIPGNTMVANLLREQEAILRNVGGEEALTELKDYIDKNVDVGFKDLYFCIGMVYDSKEYQDKVEQVMKKYCKECE